MISAQGEHPHSFCYDVCRALSLGAKRGINMAVIGGPGIGKSMLFEPMDLVYKVCGTPERESSFPLAGILGSEVLVWQEFVYNKKCLAFENLLAVLVGELVGVRLPGAVPVPYRNLAPMFYTARRPLAMRSADLAEMADYSQAMSERFKIRQWSVPLPMDVRNPNFPRCASCMSRFYYEGGCSWANSLSADHA